MQEQNVTKLNYLLLLYWLGYNFIREEIQLYKVLDELNKRKVKFALSNVIEHKGKENILLKEWSKKYKTIYLTSDYSNSSYNTKRDKSIEVLIINY